MSQAQTAAGIDRLPWLTDEPSPARRQGRDRELAGWAIAAMLFVAGGSYWMGAHSWRQPAPPSSPAQSVTTVPLPQPRPAEPRQPQVMFEPSPEIRPAPERERPVTRASVDRRFLDRSSDTTAVLERPSTAPEEKAAPAPSATGPAPMAAPKPAPAAAQKPLTAWPAWQSQGAYGRIVRIRAFGTRLQAKLGWRYMVQAYPAVAHLQATVVESRNSRGRAFYRFQIGTTSQAHSEVLCQRMERIRLSCAVVGLPWKPKGVER